MTARKKPDPHTVTVKTGEFAAMLTDLMRTAGTDATLPPINGVLLHTTVVDKQTLLVGTSTDRFKFGQANIDGTGGIPQSFLKLPDCKRLAAVLKLADREGDLVIDAIADSDAPVLNFMTDDLTICLAPNDLAFPTMGNVVKKAEMEADPRTAIRPEQLAPFTMIAKARGEGLRVHVQGAEKPIHVEIGSRYRGLVMPYLVGDPVEVAWHLPPAEVAKQESVDKARATAERKAAAEAAKAEAVKPAPKRAPRRKSVAA